MAFLVLTPDETRTRDELARRLDLSFGEATAYLLWWRYMHVDPGRIDENLQYDLSALGTATLDPLTRARALGLVSAEHDHTMRIRTEANKLRDVLLERGTESAVAEALLVEVQREWTSRERYYWTQYPGSAIDDQSTADEIRTATTILWSAFSMKTQPALRKALIEAAKVGADVRLMLLHPDRARALEVGDAATIVQEEEAALRASLENVTLAGHFEIRHIEDERDAHVRGSIVEAPGSEAVVRLVVYAPRRERGISGRTLACPVAGTPDGETTIARILRQRLEEAWARSVALDPPAIWGLPSVVEPCSVAGSARSLLLRVAHRRQVRRASLLALSGGYSGAGVFRVADENSAQVFVVKVVDQERDAHRESENFRLHVQTYLPVANVAHTVETLRLGNRWALVQSSAPGQTLRRALLDATDGGAAVAATVEAAFAVLRKYWYRQTGEHEGPWKGSELWRSGSGIVAGVEERVAPLLSPKERPELTKLAHRLSMIPLTAGRDSLGHGDLNANNFLVEGDRWALIDLWRVVLALMTFRMLEWDSTKAAKRIYGLRLVEGLLSGAFDG